MTASVEATCLFSREVRAAPEGHVLHDSTLGACSWAHRSFAAAGFMHPAVLVRQPKRRSITFLLARIFLTLTSLLGAYIYGDYRVEIRQPLFFVSPAYGWMFERKEHLAYFATLLSWVGYFSPPDEEHPGDPSVHSRSNFSDHRVG